MKSQEIRKWDVQRTSATHFVQSEEKSGQPCVPLICSAVWASLGECATAKSAKLCYWGREGLSGHEGSAKF